MMALDTRNINRKHSKNLIIKVKGGGQYNQLQEKIWKKQVKMEQKASQIKQLKNTKIKRCSWNKQLKFVKNI